MPRFPKPDPTKDRRCETCSVPTKLGSLCYKHQIRRGDFGHVKLSALPVLRRGYRGGRSSREWTALLPIAKKYLRAHPPTPDILARLQEVIAPGNPPPPTMRSTHPRAVLYREQRWWTQEAAKKRPLNRHDRYDPKLILAHLLAVQTYIEERDSGFPGESADLCLAYVLASMWRQRKYPSGYSIPLRATTRRLLSAKIRNGIGVWLIQSVREILKDRAALEALKAKAPRKPEPPPPSLYVPPAPRDRVAEMMKRFGVVRSDS